MNSGPVFWFIMVHSLSVAQPRGPVEEVISPGDRYRTISETYSL